MGGRCGLLRAKLSERTESGRRTQPRAAPHDRRQTGSVDHAD